MWGWAVQVDGRISRHIRSVFFRSIAGPLWVLAIREVEGWQGRRLAALAASRVWGSWLRRPRKARFNALR
jgi:hypothetical protein